MIPTLGETIQAWREHRGFTSRLALADNAGIDPVTLSLIERGNTLSPHPLTLRAIARAMDVSEDVLLRRRLPSEYLRNLIDVEASLAALTRAIAEAPETYEGLMAARAAGENSREAIRRLDGWVSAQQSDLLHRASKIAAEEGRVLGLQDEDARVRMEHEGGPPPQGL